jgi:hypothetical protein
MPVSFFVLANYEVIKIVRSSSDVVLQITEHTMIYPCSGPSLVAIALCSVV